jgi:hypothetical protein
VGTRRALASTAPARLLARARLRLRDKHLEALRQIERAQHASERCERRAAPALQPLHGRQRDAGHHSELPLGHVPIEAQLRKAAAKVHQNRTIIQFVPLRHKASS